MSSLHRCVVPGTATHVGTGKNLSIAYWCVEMGEGIGMLQCLVCQRGLPKTSRLTENKQSWKQATLPYRRMPYLSHYSLLQSPHWLQDTGFPLNYSKLPTLFRTFPMRYHLNSSARQLSETKPGISLAHRCVAGCGCKNCFRYPNRLKKVTTTVMQGQATEECSWTSYHWTR